MTLWRNKRYAWRSSEAVAKRQGMRSRLVKELRSCSKTAGLWVGLSKMLLLLAGMSLHWQRHAFRSTIAGLRRAKRPSGPTASVRPILGQPRQTSRAGRCLTVHRSVRETSQFEWKPSCMGRPDQGQGRELDEEGHGEILMGPFDPRRNIGHAMIAETSAPRSAASR